MTGDFKTRDLGVAAYIVALGTNISKVLSDGNIVYFIFPDKGICEQRERDYRFNNGVVVGRLFYEALRQVKGRMFEVKGEHYVR